MRNKDTGVPNTELGQDTILEELLRRASKDALSGLLNRATLERSIKERLKAMTPEETCALFIVDLDNFKQVNDTLGHRAGDQVIRQVGRILAGLFRASDIVGRLGGDDPGSVRLAVGVRALFGGIFGDRVRRALACGAQHRARTGF